MAIRRRREANLVPIVISDDESLEDSSAELVLTPTAVPQEEVQQPEDEEVPLLLEED